MRAQWLLEISTRILETRILLDCRVAGRQWHVSAHCPYCVHLSFSLSLSELPILTCGYFVRALMVLL